MLSNLSSLVAESVSEDKNTSQLSIFNVLDSIMPEGFPLFLPRMAFFAIWTKEQSDPDIYSAIFTIRYLKKILVETRLDLDFSGSIVSRSIIRISGFTVPGPGKLIFSLTTSSPKRIAKYILNVTPPDTPKKID